MIRKLINSFLLSIFLILSCFVDDNWQIKTITGYCHCVKCCGKSDGIMASGKRVYTGAVAANWLPLGSKIEIDGLGIFTVEDRMAKRYSDRIDIYFKTHQEALNFGKQKRKVKIVKHRIIYG